MYSAILSLSFQIGVGDQRHIPATFPQEKDTVAIVQKAGWVPGLVYWQKMADIPFCLRTNITASKSTSKQNRAQTS
jgi:hypothetical protein